MIRRVAVAGVCAVRRDQEEVAVSNGELHLRQKFEIRGQWWIPNNPDLRLHGTLSYHPTERAILTLTGTFRLFNAYLRTEVYQPEVVLGVS